MTVAASRQLRRYCAARVDGRSIEDACAESRICPREAALWEADRESGAVDFEAIAANIGESEMARGKNTDGAIVGQIMAPDFAKMKRIFINDLKPADEKSAKSRGDLSAAWGAIEKDAHCNKRAAKLLFKLNGESEETRDDFLRTLYGGMQALGIGISRDLVDQMNEEDAPTMPIVEGGGMGVGSLATVN